MVAKNEIYRRLSPDREFCHQEFVLVVEDSPREVVAWPCNADGDTYAQDNLRYIARGTFLALYEKVERK